jgi:hypothetical protein
MSVACGNKVHDKDLSRQHHHETTAQVRLCFTRAAGLPSLEEEDADEQGHQQALAEIEAEKRNERWFEERGGGTYAGSQEEARDRYYDSLSWEAAVASEQPGQQAREVKSNAHPSPLPPNWRDGVYTLETESGHRTFRFRTQDKESSFKPGVQIISFLHGPNNDFSNGDYTQFGEVAARGKVVVWKKHRDNKDLEKDFLAFLADPSAAKMAVHCKRCRALLTVPESIEAGWGPDCAKMGLR